MFCKTKKWESDDKFEEYFKSVWKSTCETAKMTDHILFADAAFQYVNDTKRQGSKHRKKWKITEYTLIIFSGLITVLNALAGSICLQSKCVFMATTFIAASATVITGIKEIAAYPETWLRHLQFIADVTIECQIFAAKAGAYQPSKLSTRVELTDEEIAKKQVELFIARFSKMTAKDYERFFYNMRSLNTIESEGHENS